MIWKKDICLHRDSELNKTDIKESQKQIQQRLNQKEWKQLTIKIEKHENN